MEVTTITKFRQHMKAYFEKIWQQGKPLFITRPRGQDLVIMSKSEYTSMQETFHLLRSPRNAERLLKAVQADQADQAEAKELRE
jgi:antitoxin YefM